MELISGVFTVLPIYKTMEVSNNIKWMYVIRNPYSLSSLKVVWLQHNLQFKYPKLGQNGGDGMLHYQ